MTLCHRLRIFFLRKSIARIEIPCLSIPSPPTYSIDKFIHPRRRGNADGRKPRRFNQINQIQTNLSRRRNSVSAYIKYKNAMSACIKTDSAIGAYIERQHYTRLNESKADALRLKMDVSDKEHEPKSESSFHLPHALSFIPSAAPSSWLIGGAPQSRKRQAPPLLS